VPTLITFFQGNRWSDNVYGPTQLPLFRSPVAVNDRP
jgi:hypothetical protein